MLMTGDARMRALNRAWRRRDNPTDVLSFRPADARVPASPDDRVPCLLGDVVINLDAAARQARERKLTLAAEVRRLLVHGIVHLAGYDHERGLRDARRMRALERRVLRELE